MRDIPETILAPQPDLLDRVSARLPGWNRRELERFLKFSAVGLIGAVVDFGTFNLLNALGWFSPIRLALPLDIMLTGVGIASMISFSLAVTSNFIWNRYWTYPDSRSKVLVGQYLIFFGINTAGLAIRVPILEGLRGPLAHLIEGQVGLPSGAAATIGNNLALATAVIVVLFWNFFVNRYITYSDVD